MDKSHRCQISLLKMPPKRCFHCTGWIERYNFLTFPFTMDGKGCPHVKKNPRSNGHVNGMSQCLPG